MLAASRRDGSGLALAILGWLTIAFWLSMAVFPLRIPPLGPWPNTGGLLHELPTWIRQLAGVDRPDREVVTAIDRELPRVYVVQWLKIAVGITSGILLLLRRRAGEVLAFTICAGLLGLWVINQFRMLLEPWHFKAYWTVAPRASPSVFLRWVLDPVFYAATLVFLAPVGRPLASRLLK